VGVGVEVSRDGNGNRSSISGDSSGGVTHSQLVRHAQNIFSYYNLGNEREGMTTSINPSTLKKLQAHADSKGRIKYVRGMFKNAGSEVRKFIEQRIIPMFKESIFFRGMYITLKYTSQIEGGGGKKSGAVKIYQTPHINGFSDEDKSELKKHRDIIERIKLGLYEHD